MEEEILLNAHATENLKLVTKSQFIILNFLTFNLYSVWWHYKTWHYFRKKESSDIMPAMRAIFGIFFLYALFKKIKGFAISKGYTKSYSSGLLFIGFLFLVLCSYLPEPAYILAFVAVICYAPVIDAFNFSVTSNNDGEIQTMFSIRQLVLIILGGLIWILALIGLYMGRYTIGYF